MIVLLEPKLEGAEIRRAPENTWIHFQNFRKTDVRKPEDFKNLAEGDFFLLWKLILKLLYSFCQNRNNFLFQNFPNAD